MTSTTESPMAHLTAEQLDEISEEVRGHPRRGLRRLGDRDRRYIVSMIEMHRRLVVLGRAVLLFSRAKPAWAVGTATLSLAKVLENMEIGHNVMHGQWDWMNDPQINSSTWDWDSASTPAAWKHSHSYVHHTYTNIRGKDKDLGYGSCGSIRTRSGTRSTCCSRSPTSCSRRSSNGASRSTASTWKRCGPAPSR